MRINRNKIVIVICLVLLLFFQVIPILFRIKRRNWGFSGKIQDITYDIKRVPKITVNGNSYYIPTGRSFNDEMKVGDSIVKVKGSMSYKLIKHESGEIIYAKEF